LLTRVHPRDLRVSRKVVRKIVRSDATEFRYERSTQPLPKIGPWRDRLDCLLLTNEDKPARERLTLVRLFEELRGFGYSGSYDAVRRYAISWRKERGAALAQAYVPLAFAPGEAYQFDWSSIVAICFGSVPANILSTVAIRYCSPLLTRRQAISEA
jgi:transposase